MTETIPADRCRLVLIAPSAPDAADAEERVSAALAGGDVASLILPAYDLDEASFQRRAERLTPLVQERGVAVVIAGEPRIASRVKADGIHVEASKAELANTIHKYQDRMMVGCGGVKTRDDALELGETQPDYMFFGRFGYDTKPEPHPRNLGLGAWWSEMIELPCIVLGGADISSVEAVAATGAEFVALSSAVFAAGVDPAEAVRRANSILDAKAPRFEG
ncbi:thiamine-phosphate pyrophosphorylase [Mesorhizobium sp. J18]|uniref:thiamine phosphate synthase n=1 Tax=Mesorhizobium sp. J18 TaxID=935263 RepID=UPI00119B6D46|nr:thiamine phosphate synthase [Mesorhizobium sp. J18]TWG98018.1 thiamine-phosphate pyrophosphorylase [Mesorhizobium sp. J18]